MLDRAGVSDRDVERWTHRLAGLPHLIGMGAPTRVNYGARRPDRRSTAECVRELFQRLEIGRLLQATPSRNDHLGLGHIKRTGRRGFDLADSHSAGPDVYRDRFA